MSKRVAINHQIKSSEVRLIDSDGNQLGVVPLGDALKKAQEQVPQNQDWKLKATLIQF